MTIYTSSLLSPCSTIESGAYWKSKNEMNKHVHK